MDIGLVGFGISNKAVYEHFKNEHIITIHNENEIPLPPMAMGAFGKRYLECNEDIIFRSPSVRPDKIKTLSPIFCEATYALNKLQETKICITGSDGKTTTSSLIYEILKHKNAYLGGNIGKPLINAINKNYNYVIAELSSFQLYDSSPRCDVAIITNITENHLNWHTDMDEYIRSKENLLQNASHIILNYDDKILRELGKRYKNVSYFSLNHTCDAYIKDGYLYLKNERLFSTDKIKLKGNFNLLNILASILATYKYATKAEIENAICNFKGVNNRLELIRELGRVKFYNSSIDSTPSRTIATLSALDKSKCILILGGSDKGLSYDELGKELKDIKATILLGENKNKILGAIYPYVKRIFIVNTLNEAVRLGYNLCERDDCLLLSPASASFDMYSSYVQRGEIFRGLVEAL